MARIALAVGIGVLGAITGGIGALGFLGIAGGAAGALAGGSIGLTIGSTIGAVAFPDRMPMPPLMTLQIQSSLPGSPIPFGYGTVRMAGQMLWCPGITYTTGTTVPTNTIA